MVPIITNAVIASLLILEIRYPSALLAWIFSAHQGGALLNFPELVIIYAGVGFIGVFVMPTERHAPALGSSDAFFSSSIEGTKEANVLELARHTTAINKVLPNG